VTPAAADGGIHVPVVDKFFAQFPLGGAGWRFPIQVGDLVERAKMILRGAMTLQAPTHTVGFGMVDDFHVIDLAVTSHATDTPVHVD